VIYELAFPDPRYAADHGLVAIGGDFRPERLLAAYMSGIFPWPCEELPLAWFSPDPRLVLRPAELHVSRSLQKDLRRGRYRVTFDTAFDEVIRRCALARRDGRGTWITDELRAGMCGLHRMGFAHSVEAWSGSVLVGGLYGVSIGTTFSGESMFHAVPNASKVALVRLVERLRKWEFRMVDCQVHTPHLERLGAREWHRDDFLDELALAIAEPTRRGPWTEDPRVTHRSTPRDRPGP